MPVLEKISYSENYYNKSSKEQIKWGLEGLELTKFCMITGLNSAGKSRTCNVIKNTFRKIAISVKPPQLGKTDMVFKTTDGKTYQFVLNVEQDKKYDQVITEEKLCELNKENQKILFDRKIIFDSKPKKYFDYSPPDDSLTFHARRDKVSYPYLEKIINDSTKFHFLDVENGKAFIYSQFKKRIFPNEVDIGYFPSLYKDLVTKEQKEIILDEINSLGFPIADIKVQAILVDGKEMPLIFFREKNVGTYDIANASAGMKKIIFLITCLNLVNKGTCILIDNLGDGLDFQRSIEIVTILEEKASDKQIIVCTNNEILLNQTDIRNWNILHRDGSNVKAYNYKNSKERLIRFADSGLSNYEYFMDQHYLENK